MKVTNIPVQTDKVKTDCEFYLKKINNCNALNALYCSREECSFYKKMNHENEKAG